MDQQEESPRPLAQTPRKGAEELRAQLYPPEPAPPGEEVLQAQQAAEMQQLHAMLALQTRQEEQEIEEREAQRERVLATLRAPREAIQPPQQLLPQMPSPPVVAAGPGRLPPPLPGFGHATLRDGHQEAAAAPPGDAALGGRWEQQGESGAVAHRLSLLERAVEEEARDSRALREQCAALQALLEASLRMADEKRNQEISQRAELQMQVHTNAVIGQKESATAGSSLEVATAVDGCHSA